MELRHARLMAAPHSHNNTNVGKSFQLHAERRSVFKITASFASTRCPFSQHRIFIGVLHQLRHACTADAAHACNKRDKPKTSHDYIAFGTK